MIGFHEYVETEQMFRQLFGELREQKIIPYVRHLRAKGLSYRGIAARNLCDAILAHYAPPIGDHDGNSVAHAHLF